MWQRTSVFKLLLYTHQKRLALRWQPWLENRSRVSHNSYAYSTTELLRLLLNFILNFNFYFFTDNRCNFYNTIRRYNFYQFLLLYTNKLSLFDDVALLVEQIAPEYLTFVCIIFLLSIDTLRWCSYLQSQNSPAFDVTVSIPSLTETSATRDEIHASL